MLYLHIMDLNSQILCTGINKGMLKAICLLEDGINAMGKLSCSGNLEMLCFESDWELLVVFSFAPLWVIAATLSFLAQEVCQEMLIFVF